MRRRGHAVVAEPGQTRLSGPCLGLEDSTNCPRPEWYTGAVRLAAVLASILVLAGSASTATVPPPILYAVHGRIVGWARSGPDWFAVYLAGTRRGACGLQGASWRMALVSTVPLPPRVVDDRSIGMGGAMCGNWLSWVRSGLFSDGRHREVAFMLWATPSLGATTYIYRVGGHRLRLLASFSGDRVVIRRRIVRVSFENRGRSRHGELLDVYRFSHGRYRLIARR
jgi:hypothetical protein